MSRPPRDPRMVWIDYTNWKSERAKRRIIPVRVWWGHTAWHPEDQWLLHALDLKANDTRDFAVSSIHAPVPKVIREMLEIAANSISRRKKCRKK